MKLPQLYKAKMDSKMVVPDELSGRIYRTRFTGRFTEIEKMNQLLKDWPNSELDVTYENLQPVVYFIFESSEDCLAFKLKYGENYV
jgi:hypothetical protein